MPILITERKSSSVKQGISLRAVPSLAELYATFCARNIHQLRRIYLHKDVSDRFGVVCPYTLQPVNIPRVEEVVMRTDQSSHVVGVTPQR
jgi:hypothetical protein